MTFLDRIMGKFDITNNWHNPKKGRLEFNIERTNGKFSFEEIDSFINSTKKLVESIRDVDVEWQYTWDYQVDENLLYDEKQEKYIDLNKIDGTKWTKENYDRSNCCRFHIKNNGTGSFCIEYTCFDDKIRVFGQDIHDKVHANLIKVIEETKI